VTAAMKGKAPKYTDADRRRIAKGERNGTVGKSIGRNPF
jgi:hypothetical protein